MTGVDFAPACPQCGEPIPDPAPKLCRKCSYPLVFVDRSPRLEAEAHGLETPTPVVQPRPEPLPPIEVVAPPVPTQPCAACGYGNTLDRTWCGGAGVHSPPRSRRRRSSRRRQHHRRAGPAGCPA